MRYLNKDKINKYLIVDGYNIINALENLREISKTDLEHARTILIDNMIEYVEFTGKIGIIVFDAYNVRNSKEKVEQFRNVTVVYTKEHQTADSYIEMYINNLSKYDDIKVATNDYAEQQIVLGKGATRISARELKIDFEEAKSKMNEKNKNIEKKIQRNYLEDRLNKELLSKLENIRRRR